jgi:hypothetical protein
LPVYAADAPKLALVSEATLVLPNSGGVPVKFNGVYDHLILEDDGSVVFYQSSEASYESDYAYIQIDSDDLGAFLWLFVKSDYKDKFADSSDKPVFRPVDTVMEWNERVKKAKNGSVKSIFDYEAAALTPISEPAAKPEQAAPVGAKPVNITLDGKEITADEPPYIDSASRVMVPLRFVAEAAGADVSWTPETETAEFVAGGVSVKARIGDAELDVNGAAKVMDTVAVLKNDRTFVPLRFIAEELGLKVEWDDASKTAKLASNPMPAQPAEVPAQPAVMLEPDVPKTAKWSIEGKWVVYLTGFEIADYDDVNFNKRMKGVTLHGWGFDEGIGVGALEREYPYIPINCEIVAGGVVYKQENADESYHVKEGLPGVFLMKGSKISFNMFSAPIEKVVFYETDEPSQRYEYSPDGEMLSWPEGADPYVVAPTNESAGL